MAGRRRSPRSLSRVRETPRFLREAEALGGRIRELRERKSWTLEKASHQMQIDSKHLWKIETGWRGINITLASLIRIADALGESVASLFGGGVDRVPPAEPLLVRERSCGSSGVEGESFPREADRYRKFLPFLTLRSAVEAFGAVRVVTPLGWVAPRTDRRLRPGMFVAEIPGRALDPRIPQSSRCLFESPLRGEREGRILLVAHRRIRAPETGSNFTVRRYEVLRTHDAVGGWLKQEIHLAPLDPSHPTIALRGVSEEEIAAVAELVEVLES